MKKLIITSAVLMMALFAQTSFASFPDVTSSTDYNSAIEWTVSEGITKGYGNGDWGPDNCVTRAELLKILIEYKFSDGASFETVALYLVDSSGFSDVDSNDWYYNYVRYAKLGNMVEGYEDGTFRPDNCVNRVEAMKIAVNSMLEDQEVTGSSPLYYDDKSIADMSGTAWYAKYARLLFEKRLVGPKHTRFTDDSGIDGGPTIINFFPDESMTRKEVAEMIFRVRAFEDYGLTTYTEQYSPKSISVAGECKEEGESLGAVVPGNYSYCCEGLVPYVEDGVDGTKGVCVEEEAETGMIEGSLSYPSEMLPDDLEVCAVNIDSPLDQYCTQTHIEDDKYQYGYGYMLSVPVGDYYVYAQTSAFDPDNYGDGDYYKAYYSEFVTCGLSVDCSSHAYITVNVYDGATAVNVDPWDWYE